MQFVPTDALQLKLKLLHKIFYRNAEHLFYSKLPVLRDIKKLLGFMGPYIYPASLKIPSSKSRW